MTSIFVIRKMDVPHCARGPKLCAKCQENANHPHFCLVEVFLEPGFTTRPVGEFSIKDKKEFYEYDVLRIFLNEMDAIKYAQAHPGTKILF